MSFMDGCRPRGPLETLTPELQRMTDHYRNNTLVAVHVAAVIEDLRAKRLSDEQVDELFDAIAISWWAA
jgi:hypothetical protein